LNANLSIVFRVEAGEKVGYGHLNRCVNIARELRVQSVDVVFAFPKIDPKITYILDGFQWVSLGSQCSESVSLLGELNFLSSAVGRSALLIDSFFLDYEYETLAKSFFTAVIAIDGMARPHACDLLIAPSEKKIHPTCYKFNGFRVKQGLDFVLIDPVFLSRQWMRKTPDKGKGNLLINLGGGDHIIEIEYILDSLENIAFLGNVFVVGCELSKEKYRKLNLTCIEWCSDLVGLLMNIDAVIGAAGVSAWERAALGIPSCTFVLAANQKHVAQTLKRENASTIFSGRPSQFGAKALQSGIIAVLYDDGVRRRYSENSKRCVDGKGVERVSEEIINQLKGF
jgi:spore coat polysaccharide biosynthesis predicted glycosyltransferase SpsG